MKKKLLIFLVFFIGSSFCANTQEVIDAYIQKTKQLVLNADVKKMKKLAGDLNDNVRLVLKEVLGTDTYKKYRTIYVREETARWYAGTNKVKDKSLSKDEKTLANSLFKTSNKLEIVKREQYGDIHAIIKKLDAAVTSILKKYT